MTQARRENPLMLKTFALAFTTIAQMARLMDKLDWFILGVTLTCAALTVTLY
jgi:hypothetical protein